MVDSAQRGDINCLSAYGTGGTNSGGVLAGSAIDDGIDGDLNGVLVGHDVNLGLLESAVVVRVEDARSRKSGPQFGQP